MKLLHQGNHDFLFSYRTVLDYPVHLHNAVEFVLLTGGNTTVIHTGGRTELETGDLFVSFPNQVHGYENSRNIRGYLLIIPMTPYLTAYHSILNEKVPVVPCLKKGQWEHSGIQTLLEMAYNDRNTVSGAVLQGYLMVIMGKLLSLLTLEDTRSDPADALQSTLIYVNDHYKEPLTRSSIAAAVGYNESYLSHIFANTLKTTLTNYIASLRTADAMMLLSDTGLSISQIAMQLGFGSIRSFNRVFSSQTGMTPKAFRAVQKDGNKK